MAVPVIILPAVAYTRYGFYAELRSENKAELDKLKAKNPESEKAYKELLCSGLRVEAPGGE